jgi:hypothetical protein
MQQPDLSKEAMAMANVASAPAIRREDLCVRCREIDLDDLFSTHQLQKLHKEGPGHGFMIDLVSIDDLKRSDCLLCQLFVAMAFTGSSKGTCCLAPHSGLSSIFDRYGHPAEDICLISVVETDLFNLYGFTDHVWRIAGLLGLISPANPEQLISVRSICRELYDVEFARWCLMRCRLQHGHSCNSPKDGTIPFFRLINYQSQKVIEAPPNSKYVALSYI